MKRRSFLLFRGAILLLLTSLLTVAQFSCTPTSSVRQKQIDRERAKKDKAVRKTYETELKKHLKNQSKSTKAMMKKARRDSKRLSPHRK